MSIDIKKLNKVINIILIILLVLMIIFLSDCIIEKNKIDNIVDEFKSRGQLVYQNDIYSYYKVEKKYEYEDTSNILDNYSDINVGTTGDIYVTNRNPLSGFFVTKWLSRLSYIGHGGIVYSEDGSKMVEIVGNEGRENNVVKINDNTWLEIDSPNYIILRPKNITNEQKDIIQSECNKILGSRYNYFFLISSNKRFYCTDLISYIYKKVDIILNKDMFFTTGSDIIVNDDTYMIYYRERYINNKKVCYNIYYLA